MATNFPYYLSDATEEMQTIRRNWGWLVGLGIVLILVGVLAISYPVAATITTVAVFGVLLVISGAVEIVSGIWARGWGGFFAHLLCGLLYLFVGVVLLDRPEIGAAVYTILLAVFFVAAGLFRVVASAKLQYSGWGWGVLSGAVTFLLGVLIWKQLPDSALWVIGLFVGIDLLFNGWSWVMLGLAARTVPASAPAAPAAPEGPAAPGQLANV
jgi:uncharacterized membrane protein HdeD (DUF308 family)